MGAPKKNQFWKLRAKHGRDKLFKTPKLLLDAAEEYFQWIEDNPLKEAVLVAKGIVINKGKQNEKTVYSTELPKMRPFTITGLCLYLDCNQRYFGQFEKALEGKTDKEMTDKEIKISKDFSTIITRIRETIYTQKFEGAASGFLQPNIIARDLGLRDKSDITSDDKPLQSTIIILPSNDREKPSEQ